MAYYGQKRVSCTTGRSAALASRLVTQEFSTEYSVEYGVGAAGGQGQTSATLTLGTDYFYVGHGASDETRDPGQS